MAINYTKLFDVAYSTSIPESVKEAVFDRVELPITEGLELSSDICECIRFLDNLAYSDMSEDLANSIIDDVFEGCSEEYLEEVYEAYIQAKAIQYVCEGAAPIGLKAIERESKAREEARAKKEERKQAVGKAVGDFKEGVKKLGQGAINKVKDAVGKVKDWYKANYDRPVGLAKINNFKAQNREEAPKAETKPEAKVEDKPENRQSKIDYLKKFVSKDTGDRGSSNPMAPFKAMARHARKQDKKSSTLEEPETNKQESSSDNFKQLSMLTSKGNISKKYLNSIKPKEQSKEVATEVANQPKDEVKSEAPKVEPEVKSEANKSASEPSKQNKSQKINIVDKVIKNKDEREQGEASQSDSVKGSSVQSNKPQPAKPSNKKSSVSVDEIIKGKMTGKEKSEKANEMAYNRASQDQVKYHQKAIKDYDMEIAAAEGKPAMMAKLGEIRKKREEHIKALDKLQAKV